MTETAGNGDGSDSPASVENSSNQASVPMEVDTVDDTAKSDSIPICSSPSTSSSAKTPSSARNTDSDCFKTPEAVTPTSSKKRKRLTPDEKSLREKERIDKRRKLEEEKQKKEQDRLEKAKQRDAEKARKDEEKRRADEDRKLTEEQRKAERQKKEDEKKHIEEEKRLERLKKEEERKRIEEEKKQERLKKEEDKKRKDDEKRQKLEEKEREQKKIEEKKAKQAQFFTKFFQKSSAPKVQTIDDGYRPCGAFDVEENLEEKNNLSCLADTSKNIALFTPLPFQIKTDMAVAPLYRRSKLLNDEKTALDSLICAQSEVNGEESNDDKLVFPNDYLGSLKRGKGRCGHRTEVKLTKDSPDIQILDDKIDGGENVSGYFKWRMKLLQFRENRRPAYWGTWKRKAKKASGKKPFALEKDVDYEFDSDDEWEDEPEDAEEIGDSDKDDNDEQEDGGADGEDEEEGWMVPHGYLSDSERDGTGGDLESLKNKESEFYKSLKVKTSIGFPYIETENISCYVMRLCPVFKSATTIKSVKRKPKPKITKVTEVTSQVTEVTPSKKDCQRKSKRTPKVADVKANPYAKPPSGFLAMDLPSDEEDDMDWETSGSLNASSSSNSDSGDSEDTDEEEASSDSDEDLFIPVTPSRPKV